MSKPMPHYSQNKQLWIRDFERVRDPRVNFKPGNKFRGKKEYGNNKVWRNTTRGHLQDVDVNMGVNSGTGRNFNRKLGGKHWNGLPSGLPILNNRRKLSESLSGWYKIMIPRGENYEKNFLLTTLLERLAPLPFWPIAWRVHGTACIFYVDEYKVAEKLLDLNRQIQLPNGFWLPIRVHPGAPNIDINSTIKEKMKLVMAKRYNAGTKALDLTKFHADPDLQDYFCALFKSTIFLAVIDIIAENIPELEALNLFDNKLSGLNVFKKSLKKIPKLKILHMGHNKLKDIAQLDPLQGFPIVDLVLDGNPLCDKFEDQATYISEVRKRFPKCMKLDSFDLPPPIGFDITEEHHVPSTQKIFLCNADASSVAQQCLLFLQQYFQVYDTEDRQPLLQAYHENAMFSMTMAYPHRYGKDKNVAWLNWYAADNRNVKKVQDTEKRYLLLRQGQSAIINYLKDMPLTEHDIHGFTVDFTICTPDMLCLTVSGIFKEINNGHKTPPFRFFFRTLVLVPAGSGFCIVNELLHISNALPNQAKDAFKNAVAGEPSNPGTSSADSVSSTVQQVVPSVPVLDDATKQEMVHQMSSQSEMNLEWSFKCLDETHWDFQRAIEVFQQFKSRGVIPEEAFVQ